MKLETVVLVFVGVLVFLRLRERQNGAPSPLAMPQPSAPVNPLALVFEAKKESLVSKYQSLLESKDATVSATARAQLADEIGRAAVYLPADQQPQLGMWGMAARGYSSMTDEQRCRAAGGSWLACSSSGQTTKSVVGALGAAFGVPAEQLLNEGQQSPDPKYYG